MAEHIARAIGVVLTAGPPQVDYLRMVRKHRPPIFKGQQYPEELEEWIDAFDILLTTTQCPEEKKVGVATYHFKKLAAQWWRVRKQGLTEGYSWEDLKGDLREHFYPTSLRSAKHEEFNALQQGNMTVHEYYARFMGLLNFVPSSTMTERDIAQKFEFGLNNYIREAFGGKQFTSLQKGYDQAIAIEK